MEKELNQMDGCCDKMKEIIGKNPGIKDMMQNCMDQFFDSGKKEEETDKDSSDQAEDSTKKACC